MFLLLSFIIGGIMAEDPSVTHYRLKNSSICLHVQKPPPYHGGQWRFAGKVIASDRSVNPNYTEKVDYTPENLTLCIYKLTEWDSGIYTVTFHDTDFNSKTDIHRVVVQEAVPRPVIRMSTLRSNLSAGACTIIVNCSVQKDWVWSVCNEDSCRTSQKSFSKVNISISTDNTTIVCIGNNHVSTSNVSESMEATCFRKSNPKHNEASQPLRLTKILIPLFVTPFIIIIFILRMAKKCFSTENNPNQTQTSNAQLTQSQPQGSLPRPRVSTSSSQADATYENVDEAWASQTIDPTIDRGEELGSKQSQSQKVDTVYSVLQVPNVTAFLGKSESSKDMKGYKKMEEAIASESVPLEAEHTTQIDTLYSVLQKPNNLKSQHHQQVKQDTEKPKS